MKLSIRLPAFKSYLVLGRNMLNMRSDSTKHICLITLCLITSILVASARADEEFTLIKTLQSPKPSDRGGFGFDIALDADFLIIGEWYASIDDLEQAGGAYIYDSQWSIISTLTSSVPANGDTFGNTVDVNGDMVVVGSPRTKPEGNNEVGEAHVFNSEGSLLFILQSPTPSVSGYFGYEAVLGRDIIVVAEPGGVKEVYFAGCIHVYDSEGVHITTLVSPSKKANSEFGRSLAVSDEYIIAGEPGWYGGAIERGSVHVFDYSWMHVATLNAPEQGERTLFGYRVAIDGDIIVVGEPLAAVDGHEKAGRAHIFDTGWNHLVTLQAPAPEDNGEFGIDVAVSGDLVVVGECKRDLDVLNEGAAYVFDLEGNLVNSLVSPEPSVGAQFGTRVAVDGEIVVVSEVEATVDGVSKAGKVYVFGLGEPVTEQPTQEDEIIDTESESESEKSGGIPGFPLESVVISLALAVLGIWFIRKQR